jgi:hypothetical protein
MPSLLYMRLRWVSIVLREGERISPISALVLPFYD